jgi:hypothetical protein
MRETYRRNPEAAITFVDGGCAWAATVEEEVERWRRRWCFPSLAGVPHDRTRVRTVGSGGCGEPRV